MNVCMLMTNFYPRLGGGEEQLRKLSSALIKKGVKVDVLTRKYSKDSRFDSVDDIDIYRMPILKESSRAISSISYIIFSLFWLVKNSRKYDILHCHQAYSPAIIGALIRLLLKKKVIVKITASNEYGEVEEIKRLPLFKIRKSFLKKIDKFVAINASIQKELESIGIFPKKILYIPNGVLLWNHTTLEDDIKYKNRTLLGLPYKKIVIFTGRLSEEKSLDILLVAWKRIVNIEKDVHLLILGKGGRARNVESSLKDMSAALNLQESVHFLGRVDNVKDYLLASDVFVLPSISEGMSNALLEAMAAGLAIVASRIDANIDIIQNGTNGILVERRSPQELADAIIRLTKDEVLAKRLGKAARKDAEDKYSIELIADRYIELYRQLI